MAPKNLMRLAVPDLTAHLSAQIAEQTRLTRPVNLRLNTNHDKEGHINSLSVELVQGPLAVVLVLTLGRHGMKAYSWRLWRCIMELSQMHRYNPQRFQTYHLD